MASRKKHHRSTRWYLSGVFLQALDWAAANSGVLYQDFNGKKSLDNKNVKKIIAYKLRNFYLTSQHKPAVSDDEEDFVPIDTRTKKDEIPLAYQANVNIRPTPLQPHEISDIRLDPLEQHWPFTYTGRPQLCVAHTHRHRTQVFCGRCKVFLCVKNNCFYKFHTQEDYMDRTVYPSKEKRKQILY